MREHFSSQARMTESAPGARFPRSGRGVWRRRLKSSSGGRGTRLDESVPSHVSGGRVVLWAVLGGGTIRGVVLGGIEPWACCWACCWGGPEGIPKPAPGTTTDPPSSGLQRRLGLDGACRAEVDAPGWGGVGGGGGGSTVLSDPLVAGIALRCPCCQGDTGVSEEKDIGKRCAWRRVQVERRIGGLHIM